jgi:S-phase kinase-associated protein 1
MCSIKLKSVDGDVFEVDQSVASVLGTIRNMIEELGVEYVKQEVIPIPTLSTGILHKVLLWAEQYKDHPAVQKASDDHSLELNSWDQEFFNVRFFFLGIRFFINLGFPRWIEPPFLS